MERAAVSVLGDAARPSRRFRARLSSPITDLKLHLVAEHDVRAPRDYVVTCRGHADVETMVRGTWPFSVVLDAEFRYLPEMTSGRGVTLPVQHWEEHVREVEIAVHGWNADWSEPVPVSRVLCVLPSSASCSILQYAEEVR